MKKSRNGKFTIYEENDKCALDEYSKVLAEELEKSEEEQDKTIQKNTETIETLQKENTELKAENERLNNDINAISVTEQAEGENITLNDTAEARFKKFVIGGNSWQETGDVTDEEGNVIGTMPSPNYKSDIQNVTGNANVTICNKNMFDINSVSEDVRGTLDKYETGIGATWRNIRYTEVLKIRTIKAGTYKICGKQTVSNTNSGDTVRFYYEDGTSVEMGIHNNYIPTTIIFTKDVVAMQLFINSNKSTGDYFRIDDFMLVSTDVTDVSYVEHQEQNFQFPLAEGQKLMLNDYLADDGIHHKRKQISINSSLGNYNSNDNWYYISNSNFANLIKVGNSLSNYFTYKPISYLTSNLNASGVFSNTGTHFVFRVLEFTSAAEYRNFFTENSVIIEYDIAEEEIESYTEEQQTVHDEIKKTAHSYGDTTHIFCTDETSLIFNVEARKDMNTVISNLESMILANASEEV